MTLRLTLSGRSDIGKVRSRNEDSMNLEPGLGLAIVADGMGGHPGGDVASRIAAEVAADSLRHALGNGAVPDDGQGRSAHLRDAMAQSVQWAHAAIRREGEQDPRVSGMGTTLTALIVDAHSGVWVIGHVGDSRAYRFRDGEFVQLTRDDTWVQQRVDADELTEEQARHHPFGHILTQCLGLEDAPDPHILTGHAQPGDVYLLCTDGLVGMVPDSVLADTLAAAFASAEDEQAGAQAAERMLDLANQEGGRDNITVALVAVDDAGGP